MSVELTKVNIEGAIQRAQEWYSHPHPVIRTAILGGIEFKSMRKIRDEVNQKRASMFELTRFDGMISAIDRIEDFNLEPLDIIGIWACTKEASEDQQSALARFIIAKHAVNTMETPGAFWRFYVPDHFMKEGVLLP